MTPRRILFVVRERAVSGICTGLLGLLRHLDAARYHGSVVVLGGRLAYTLFRNHGISATLLQAQASLMGLLTVIERLRADLIQSCDAASVGALAAHRLGLPHVWFVGGSLKATFTGASQQALQTLPAIMDRLSDAVIVPSADLAAKEFSRRPSGKLHVIPWGIELASPARRPLARPWLRRRHRFPLSSPLVAMVGNFYPAKQHRVFLKAAALIHRACPETRFLMAGQCSGITPQASELSRRYRVRIVAALRRLRLDEIVKLDHFAHADRSRWFGAIDLLLVPSHEGLSQAMLEAMACGIPVIAADIGGNPEVIQHEASGWLVPYRNPRAMAKAALGILKTPALAKRLGQGGQHRVFSAFSAARQAKRFQALYDSLLTARRS